MKITTSSMEDISGPATSERADSRWSSVSSLEVGSSISLPLVDDTIDITTDIEDTDLSIEIDNSFPDGSADQCQSHAVSTDIENEDPDLQQAIAEMKRLDIILASKLRKEIEVKHEGKDLRKKLWQELLRMPKSSKECAQEAVNTRLFLALESPSEQEPKEDDDFEPVFGTQLSDQEFETDTRHKEQSGNSVCRTVGSSDVGPKEKEEEQSERSNCGASRAKKKQEDFVKKNIELASAGRDHVLMTQMEMQRLTELLSEIEEEVEENARETDSEEGMWAVSVSTGHGYTPEPFELARLNNITSSLHFLLPAEDFPSEQSSYINRSLPQEEEASAAGWEPIRTPQPGEVVLKHLRKRREQELRLHEIQEQLETLSLGQQRTNEAPSLAEDQLLSLLEECELSESWYRELGSGHTTPLDHHREDSFLTYSPAPSDDLVAESLTCSHTDFNGQESGIDRE